MAQREVYVGRAVRARPAGHDPAAIVSALRSHDPDRRRIMVTDQTDLMKAVRRGNGGWQLHVIERFAPKGTKPIGFARTRRRGVEPALAEQVLVSYLEGTDDWRTAVRWRKGLAGRSPYVLIPAVFVIGTAIVLGVQAATGNLEGWSSEYVPNLIVGVGMISLITMYASFFADVVRPRLARALGGKLGLQIAESTRYERDMLGTIVSRPGYWESEGGTPARRATVHVLDLIVLLVGGVLPIAVIGVGIVLTARPILA